MSDDGTAGLPAELAMIWRLKREPPRPSRQGLSVDRIVDAAIEVADARGIGGVSMARVAEHLGFTPMSLYRHVSSKDELLMLMRDRVAEVPSPSDEGLGWRGRLEAWTRDLRQMFTRHSWLLDITPFAPPLLPSSIEWMEHGLRALSDTVLPPAERLAVITALNGYAFQESLFLRDLGRTSPDDQELKGYGAALAQVIDRERHPQIATVLASGTFEPKPDGAAGAGYTDEDFSFGLDLILDGVAVLIERYTEPT